MTAHRLEHYEPPSAPYFSVIYVDDAIIVLSKQAGLLTVPGKDPAHGDCLERRVQALFPDARISHRLDMSTSGLLVMPRGMDALRHVNKQFEKRSVKKKYQAIVAGHVGERNGTIDLPIAVDWPNRPRQHINHEHGRQAITRWEVVEYEQDTTRINLFPETGRSHQLRVHMTELGHPILGDEFYATGDVLIASPRLLLHATALEIWHPVSGVKISFTDDPVF